MAVPLTLGGLKRRSLPLALQSTKPSEAAIPTGGLLLLARVRAGYGAYTDHDQAIGRRLQRFGVAGNDSILPRNS